jgi:inner membrane protein
LAGYFALESNALLIGAVASFAAVAAAMYFTRNLDWYGGLREGGTIRATAVPSDREAV